jgi:outer membrane protein assembly factor BamB
LAAAGHVRPARNLFALDRNTGAQIWSHRVSDYTGIVGDYAVLTKIMIHAPADTIWQVISDLGFENK